MSNKREFDIMDMLNILSFYVGIKNLDENLTQNDATSIIENAVEDIHNHLQEQDEKLNFILEALKK